MIIPSTYRILLGQLAAAWRDYPRIRREIASFPPGPPIFVTGTHRSGTTWVAQMLSAPGLWHVHEPFNPNQHTWQESFTYVRPGSEAPCVDEYVRRILSGAHRAAAHIGDTSYRLMPLRLLRQPIQRVMIKDPLACLLTGYLATRFRFQTLVLFRHPCGFVASVTRLGWPTGEFLTEMLRRPELMEDHLGPYEHLMRKHQNEDTIESAAVLHGVLNKVLWYSTTCGPQLRWARFEDLCARPIEMFQNLYTDLQLPYTNETRDRHQALCSVGSEDPADYRPHAVARNSPAMAMSWKQQLSEASIASILDIWNSFDIPIYDSVPSSLQ